MKEGGELSGPLPWQAPTRLFGRGSLLQTFYKKFGTVWGIQTLVSGSFSLVKHHANPRPGTVSDVTGDQIGVPLCLLWVWQPTNWALRTWFWHPPKDGKVEGAEPEEKAEDEATTGPAVVGSFRCQDYISSVSLPPPDQLARGRAFGQCAASASEDEDGEASEVFWEPHEANTEVDIAEHPLALRPRGKHTSKEWAQAVQEGWVDKLPYVKGTTLARYSKNLAWSTKYPTEDGMRHFLRSFPAQRTPFVALLQCMEWLVQQHYRKCGTHLSLTAELRDRLKMEKDCFHPLCDCCPGCFSFNTEMS